MRPLRGCGTRRSVRRPRRRIGRGRPRDEARRRGRGAAGRRGDPRRDRGSGIRGSLMAVATPETETLRLDVEGMTCASCAARIERKLNKLDGVEATVNFATEQATVRSDHPIAPDALSKAVEGAGYGASEAAPLGARPDRSLHPLRRRLTISTALTVPLA